MPKLFLLLILLPAHIFSQQQFSSYKKYPFPTGLSATKDGRLSWAFDEEGKRNIYVAEGPDYKAKKITDYVKDDGQELTSISISENGKWVAFVRGGDHGGNWGAGVITNASLEPNAFKIQVGIVPFEGGPVRYISEGEMPIFSPDSKSVLFFKGEQLWTAPADGSSAAKSLFVTKGSVKSAEWAPDGHAILFAVNRVDHSLMGVFNVLDSSLHWVSPSFNNDQSPHWSPEGNKIVFIRTPGNGGVPESILSRKIQNWSICTAEIVSGKTVVLWQSPNTLYGSKPTTEGGTNLHWAANNRIVFLSNLDGWPHLYSMDANGGKPTLLTPGNFMCEHIVLSNSKKYLTFSANTGANKVDIEKRHIAIVDINKESMEVLSNGEGLEWTPILTNNEKSVAFISATYKRPPLPSILPVHASMDEIKIIGSNLISSEILSQRFVVPKPVTFKSADGMVVHADLFMPDNAGKNAAIIFVHGGPPRQMLLGWNYSDYYSNAYANNQYLASLGFVVLAVNYRLGIGYGVDFHNPAKGGPTGASEYLDIKAAGDWLKNQPFVKSKKIGIYGGSYGGYLTALALARDSKLFVAGVDIHGVNDWSPMFQTNDKYEKSVDYELAKKTAWMSSPVSSMKTWKSPVLIIHGDDDRNVRFNQSVDLINRLEKYKVPFETLIIPDDTHHWMKWSNAVLVYQATADFFLKHLK